MTSIRTRARPLAAFVVAVMASVLVLGSTAGATEHQSTGEVRGRTIQNISLPGDDHFEGRLVGLKFLEFNEETNEVLTTGRVIGTVTNDGVTERVNMAFSEWLPVSTGLSSFQNGGQECPILFLDLGPIFLDLLGLQLDISPITIELTAVRGPGNLLGNLLCALVGILDPQVA
jgi:hypothetical protein